MAIFPCQAFPYLPQTHLDWTTYYRIAGFHMSPWLYRCSLKPILRLTMFNDSSGRHVFLRSTLSQQKLEPLAPHYSLVECSVLTVCCDLHSELFAQTITYYPTESYSSMAVVSFQRGPLLLLTSTFYYQPSSLVMWQTCLSCRAVYAFMLRLLRTLLGPTGPLLFPG